MFQVFEYLPKALWVDALHKTRVEFTRLTRANKKVHFIQVWDNLSAESEEES